jgi:radical SAM superfamily enzyme YgiQ (UPF0313 family)
MFRSLSQHRSVCLVQLPIPPLRPEPIRGNVPLAAAYLKLWANKRGLDTFFDIQLFPPALANTLGDRALVEELARLNPWLLGFTCYVWNIERTLWIARELKRLRPEVRIVLGGPEITPDNCWVLETCDYDFAVVGEGEQTFAQLLFALLENEAVPEVSIPGLYVPPAVGPRFDPARRPAFRVPISDLNTLGSPYRAGILNVADERMLLLETTRGCRFKCKFCYYPKAYDKEYYLAAKAVLAELDHAAKAGAQEVMLLDPTLNQRKDFADFLRLLIKGNSGANFRYFGELRGEGITAETAALLREANFTEVEVGLQSIEPQAMSRMDRRNNLRAFERGVRAMMREGIRVKVDLIVGLPGDTVESIRRGFRYLHDGGLFSDVQVFNLAILPGTAFREEAVSLGLKFQSRPPYHVLRTPTLDINDLFGLMREAQELFGVEFDAPPPPIVRPMQTKDVANICHVDLDRSGDIVLPARRAQAFTLLFQARDFERHVAKMAMLIRRLLKEDPFTTLQVLIDSGMEADASAVQNSIQPRTLANLLAVCLEHASYLDKLCAWQPSRPAGAKRLVVLLPAEIRASVTASWLEAVGAVATVVWRGGAAAELEENQFAWAECC